MACQLYTHRACQPGRMLRHETQLCSRNSSKRQSQFCSRMHLRCSLSSSQASGSWPLLSKARRCLQPRSAVAATANDMDYESCVAPLVSIDNESHPKYTKLTIEVLSFTGLLRVISWVLNGLGMRVQNAVCKTDDEGFVTDELWITDLRGKKLTSAAANDVLERIQDNITTCIPRKRDSEQQEFTFGNISVSNIADEKYTKIVIKGEPAKPGFLLELSSVVTGVGLDIHAAVIQSENLDKDPFLNVPAHNFQDHGRVFQFLVADKDGTKLDYSQISALLYTLQLVVGLDSSPVTAPNITFTR